MQDATFFVPYRKENYMKVIKRDGRAVDYDRQKIAIAIGKANNEVPLEERATKDEINGIMEYIESLNRKRMLVEDIQDIIEQKLMSLGRFALAKKYIVYRYTRALVRKANTTDESILGIIRNENKGLTGDNPNKNTYLASAQRDYIAGEVSRDLTGRLLLPEKITKADQEGILHFHAADYFIQPIFNCCLVNIGDMLDNGTVMNGNMLETPKSFQVACTIMTQIIAAIASNQYGGQSIDLIHLGKYVRKSYDKIKRKLEEKYKGMISADIIEEMARDSVKNEVKAGVQTIQYQITTLMTTNGRAPQITLFLHLDPKDEYIKENAMIIQEILRQKNKGMKDEHGEYMTPVYPKLIYVLDECNNLTGGEYDYLTRQALECTAQKKTPAYISAKKMRENYEGNVFSPCGSGNFLSSWKDEKGQYQFEGRFNQGVVSINLPQIGIIADGDEDKFWELLEDRLELCKEALLCRHYALLGTTSEISPIHWQYGAIARLAKGEKIDSLLKDGYSTLALGYIGIYELTKLMKGVSHTTKGGRDFAVRVIKKLNDATKEWERETGLGFVVYGTSSKSLGEKFASIDKERFGTIPDITNKGAYTNSYHINRKEKIDTRERLTLENEFQALSKGGDISYIPAKEIKNNAEEMIHFMYENVQYAEIV